MAVLSETAKLLTLQSGLTHRLKKHYHTVKKSQSSRFSRLRNTPKHGTLLFVLAMKKLIRMQLPRSTLSSNIQMFQFIALDKKPTRTAFVRACSCCTMLHYRYD